MSVESGFHFLQIPGPTNIPGRVLRAMSQPVIDHRGLKFARLAVELLAGLRWIFRTAGAVVIFPSSGTGALEAALVNTLSPGDRVLMFNHGFFADHWRKTAQNLGIRVDFVPCEWDHAVPTALVEERLRADVSRQFKAVMILHNETSTGVTNSVAAVRDALDRVGHPGLLMVDTISSLASIDYRHEEWGVDVSIGSSQKGLMLPPGLGFNAVSDKALTASKSSTLPKSYWSWEEMFRTNEHGFFPYTPATNLLFGMRESLRLLREEGLEPVFNRHHRHAEATRRAIEAWGLERFCSNHEDCSNTVTAVTLPQGHDADELRSLILQRFDMSLGAGLGKLRGRVFRIGHLGHFNDLMLAGTLSGIEIGLSLCGVPFSRGGVQTAIDYLSSEHAGKV